jgi:hypothetical protein
VVDYIGRKVYFKSQMQLPGTLNESIPLMNAATGIYFISVYVNDKRVSVKKVLKH